MTVEPYDKDLIMTRFRAAPEKSMVRVSSAWCCSARVRAAMQAGISDSYIAVFLHDMPDREAEMNRTDSPIDLEAAGGRPSRQVAGSA